MPRRTTSASWYFDLTRADVSAEEIADDAARRAVGAWQSARLVRLASERKTGRTEAENDRLRLCALRAIRQIIRSAGPRAERSKAERSRAEWSKAERRALRDSAAPLRATVRTVFASMTRAPRRPVLRRAGYKSLADCVRRLMAAGQPEDAAIRFVIERLLALYPPETNQPWLYVLEPYEVKDAQRILGNRLSVFLHPKADRKKSPRTRR